MNNTKEKQTTDYDNPPVVPRRRKGGKNNFFIQFAISFLCVFVLAIIIYRGEISTFISNIFVKDSSTSKWENNFSFNSRRQNILIMGVDVSDNKDKPFEGTRTDSIYLVSLAPHARNVNIISIPRDSKVYINSKSAPDKINHAFAFGGINTSIKTIEETLGVKIDHYFVISNIAVIDMIDAMGGLDVYVEKDMQYDDYTAKLHINLEKGVRHLNGKEAEGYLRFRKDALGDIGRIRRQQWFLNAFANKLKDKNTILKLPDIIKASSKNILTDLSFYEIAQYAALIKSLDSSKIRVATLPGEPSQRGIVSYWILDPKGVQDIVNKMIYGHTKKTLDRPLEAGILYNFKTEQKALELQKELEANGIKVTLRQAKYLGHDHIAIHNFDIPDEDFSRVKNTIYILKDKQTVYDIIGINKAARDFTVILAGT